MPKLGCTIGVPRGQVSSDYDAYEVHVVIRVPGQADFAFSVSPREACELGRAIYRVGEDVEFYAKPRAGQ